MQDLSVYRVSSAGGDRPVKDVELMDYKHVLIGRKDGMRGELEFTPDDRGKTFVVPLDTQE